MLEHHKYKDQSLELTSDNSIIRYLRFSTIPNVHENMMQPESDKFLLSKNEGASMDKRDKDWSMIKHEDGSKPATMQGLEMVLQV
jgi:hypothetical protein